MLDKIFKNRTTSINTKMAIKIVKLKKNSKYMKPAAHLTRA